MAQKTITSKAQFIARFTRGPDSEEFNRVIGEMQGLLGQDDGGVAGAFFSGMSNDEWAAMSVDERLNVLAQYIKSEIDFLIVPS